MAVAKRLRTMNERATFFGLNIWDGVGLSILFMAVNTALSDTPYELFSFLSFILPLPILIPIRMKKRRKIIRDTLLFYCFSPRRLYDPKMVS